MAQDAVALIKADHRKVEQLFREFEEAGDRAYKTKQQLVEQIIRELEVHATIEEETYYPAVEAKAKKDGKELVAEAVEEHHVEEEEEELLPQSEEVLGDEELTRLGEEMAARKKQLGAD